MDKHAVLDIFISGRTTEAESNVGSTAAKLASAIVHERHDSSVSTIPEVASVSSLDLDKTIFTHLTRDMGRSSTRHGDMLCKMVGCECSCCAKVGEGTRQGTGEATPGTLGVRSGSDDSACRPSRRHEHQHLLQTPFWLSRSLGRLSVDTTTIAYIRYREFDASLPNDAAA